MQVNTFSIVACDLDEQAWGVAVASKFLAAAAVVSWAQAGVGAVATQALAKVGFGPDGLGLMGDGKTAEEALVREVREELNVELAELTYLTSAPNRYLYHQIDYPVLDLFYVCKVKSFDAIKPLDDIDDFVWIRPADIEIDQLFFESTRAGMGCYLKTNTKS